jgi:cytoskeletal protein RodZ
VVPLEQIAKETKIRIDFLHSIEKDNIQAFPATIFLKGLIKSYLKCLCLEPVEEICRKYLNR